jgi:FdrA protein
MNPLVRAWVRTHEYRDSMVLMYLSAQLEKLPGVLRAMAIMGTENNKELLATVGLQTSEAATAGPNDLLIVLRVENEAAAESAAGQLDELLAQRQEAEGKTESVYRSVESAAQALPGANLALISVPGRFAAREARRSLDLGLHVFIFSDNVPLAEEVELKRLGRERGLLVMGPDCGTGIVGGVALGFANAVRRGPIGIVGAAGTGIQEVSTLVDRAGYGISHAIGTGGRDLSQEVGASTTLQAIDLLDRDDETAVLVVISKVPAAEVAARVLARASVCRKPVVACLLGAATGAEEQGNVLVVGTLAQAAEAAVVLAGGEPGTVLSPWLANRDQALAERGRLAPGQRYVRGLFSGGSLCEEAMVVWRDSLGPVRSNAPLQPELALVDPRRSEEHTAVDLGDDFFTAGRPHPMIDPTVRQE